MGGYPEYGGAGVTAASECSGTATAGVGVGCETGVAALTAGVDGVSRKSFKI